MIDPDIIAHIRGDAYANLIGATIDAIEPGYCRASLLVSESMLNFHGTTHGGIVFGLADIAFAAACNSHGQTAVALNVNISFVHPTRAGERLVAEAREVSLGGATAVYDVVVTGDGGRVIAKCQATAYRKRASLL
jgi:acyl-CoA thioesterase